MNALDVFYDDSCGLCRRCRAWLAGQVQIVPLRFIPLGGCEARRRLEGLVPPPDGEELIVVSDRGDVYRGSAAYLMSLWALRDYRPWAHRLAHPRLLPLARRAFDVLSSKRHTLSRLLGADAGLEQLVAAIDDRSEPCAGGAACARGA